MALPLRDLQFILFELHDLPTVMVRTSPAGGGLTRAEAHDTAVAILEAAERLAQSHFAPFAAKADAEEPRIESGRVRLPPETGLALKAHAEGGFLALAFAEAHGGLGQPFLLSQGCASLFAAANVGFVSYAMLTQGAANLIAHVGSESQRRRWLAPMLAGRVFGTMCLSEPHAGSSLADIRTLATPTAEGRYRLTGRKMWISGGEHELADNIVHLVLARTPNAPAGVKGISLFLVPRLDPDSGRSNGVSLVGLNHKMGWRAHVNAAIAFGDTEPCEGELVGELHQGLAGMFLMMNEARVAVGLNAAAIGYAGYRYALTYARERRQGRPLNARDPHSAQVPIVEHPDVRRMLLSQKAWVEGALELTLYCARLVDEQRTGETDDVRRQAALLLDLLTPVAKSWPAEYALEANKLAIQVAGGAGYTRDLPLERLYRDNRLNHIHEGAYGIQGLDLLGRKVALQDGRALALWRKEIGRTLAALRASETFETQSNRPQKDDLDLIETSADHLVAVTRKLLDTATSGHAELALANATLYLDAFGIITVAWRWLEQARLANAALSPGAMTSANDEPFYRGKLAACRWYLRHELPRARIHLERLAALEDTALRVRDEEF